MWCEFGHEVVTFPSESRGKKPPYATVWLVNTLEKKCLPSLQETAVERIWHLHDSQGQILALAFRWSLNVLKRFIFSLLIRQRNVEMTIHGGGGNPARAARTLKPPTRDSCKTPVNPHSGSTSMKCLCSRTNKETYNLNILVCLVMHHSGQVSLEHLLLSRYPFLSSACKNI
jgi:hypothetical protein